MICWKNNRSNIGSILTFYQYNSGHVDQLYEILPRIKNCQWGPMGSADRGQQRWLRVCNRRCGIIFLNRLRLRVSFSSAFLMRARAIQVSTGCIGFWGGKCLRFTVSFTLPQRSLILFCGAKLTLILLRASGFNSTKAGLYFRSFWLTARALWDLFPKWEVEVNFICV
jgi:hypothetical protein